MKKIAIIGFGFCGIMVFGNLLKKIIHQKGKLDINFLIFEKDGFENIGAGFSDFCDSYILNVPAKKMNAFVDSAKDSLSEDFLTFLKKNYPEIYNKCGEDGFVARNIYGQYLSKLRDDFFTVARQNNIDFQLIKKEVIDIKNNFDIYAHDQEIYKADEVVLATSFSQSRLNLQSTNQNFVSPIWSNKAKFFHKKTDFSEKDVICMIGTGLTAVDILVGLKAKNFAGKVYAISRRGNFPKSHLTNSQQISEFVKVEDAKSGLINLSLKFREFLRYNKNHDLRPVIDSIRSITKDLWQNFDDKNKKLFLKKLLPYWDIFRHRAPENSLKIINEMISKGNLEIVKSSIKLIEESSIGFNIALSNGVSLQAKYLVNCLGFDFNLNNYPLLSKMVQNNLLKKDSIIAQSLHKNLHLVGALNVGRDFENTAVPDLRVDAHNVALRIFENIRFD